MKVVILTSSHFGTAANHLPDLVESKVCDVAMVILSEGHISNKKKHFRKKFRKTLDIGIAGALNGIRMRKWFNEDMKKYKTMRGLKEICAKYNIPFFTTPIINSEETIKLFRQADADLGLSLGNGYIGKKVFSIPRFGMLNIHHEILPEYQNAQSIIWQIYNGSANTGYTIHKIDRHIDTGEILYQEKVPIKFKATLADTIAHTSALLLEASSKGLIHTLKNFENLFAHSRPQGHGRSYTTPSMWQYLRIYRNYKRLRKTHSTDN